MTQAILLIDDDALLRRSLAYTLERAGYRVSAAGTAVEGGEITVEGHPGQGARFTVRIPQRPLAEQ